MHPANSPRTPALRSPQRTPATDKIHRAHREGPSPAERLEAIAARYPDLDRRVQCEREIYEHFWPKRQWAGLNWVERAIMFIPPAGPLVAAAMMESNKITAIDALGRVEELEAVIRERDALQRQV